MKSNHSYNFYQPSAEELKDDHLHQLMDSLHSQEDSILKLLLKY